MKVLIVANSYWNLIHFRRPIIRMLRARGTEVHLLSPPPVKNIRPEENFHPLHYCRNQRQSVTDDVRLLLEFYRIFKKSQPDLILLYTIKPNIFGNLAAARLRIPVISTVTGLGYTFLRGGSLKFLTLCLYKFAFRRTRKVIFHNPTDLRLFAEQELVAPGQCRVIPGSGVDVRKFSPLPAPAHRAKFIFLFIGRLLTDKGIREYLAAAQLLSDLSKVEFHIIGDLYPENPASLTAEEFQAARAANSRLVWHGSQAEVRPFIAAANVFVLPSYREGLSMAILENMAMGKPIITTDVPGCRETIEAGENGLLVPPKNTEKLAEAMRKMYHLPSAARRRMGEKSRAKAVAEFSAEKIAAAYANLIFADEK